MQDPQPRATDRHTSVWMLYFLFSLLLAVSRSWIFNRYLLALNFEMCKIPMLNIARGILSHSWVEIQCLPAIHLWFVRKHTIKVTVEFVLIFLGHFLAHFPFIRVACKLTGFFSNRAEPLSNFQIKNNIQARKIEIQNPLSCQN